MDAHTTRLRRIAGSREHDKDSANAEDSLDAQGGLNIRQGLDVEKRLDARQGLNGSGQDLLTELTSMKSAAIPVPSLSKDAPFDMEHETDMPIERLKLSGMKPSLGAHSESFSGIHARTQPRLVFTQAQAIVVILILVCALAASMTLLIRQRIHYGNSQDLAALALSRSTESNGNAAEDAGNDAGDDADENAQSGTGADASSESAAQQSMETDTGNSVDATDDEQGALSSQQPTQTAESDSRININTADANELMTLNGVGPVTAEKILEYRKRAGKFVSVDELLEVSGIGAKTLEKLRSQVRVQ
ncbi:MAG: ComEA family DNA-binding protein [Bifidobacterium sp.]|uniref:ComEA family DNA-binding protein n=1 Tax=Bifidobacterium fermentum TaxID=3059035 RepID=A0AB39UEM1_9BIFI